MTALYVVHPGLLTTVQDLGRWGYEHWGVPVGGALDDRAMRWANWLVGNSQDAAVLEITAAGPELVVQEGGVLGLAGADLAATVEGRPWPPGKAFMMEAGWHIRFGARRYGLRAYVAFSGGIDVPKVLGSAATDLVAGIGGIEGRPLSRGDVVRSKADGGRCRTTWRARARVSHTLRVLPGVRRERFVKEAFAQLLTQEFRVSPDSSAMGLRLDGALSANPRGDWPSEGMAIGSIECPPGGTLLVLLKNRGSIGGYPALAHVIRADWPLLGQLVPGDRVQFEVVSLETAHQALARQDEEFLAADHELLAQYVTSVVTGLALRRDVYGRRLPESGDWVYQGQLVLRLESLQTVVNIHSPGDGFVDLLPHEGQLVFEDAPLFSVKGGIGRGDG